jgi:hypothetical protein
MNNDYRNYLIIGLLAVIVILLLIFVPKKENDDVDLTKITDFVTCSEAGYPVSKSFPAQCTTPDNRTFVEDINEQQEVIISTPARDSVVTSPLTVKGQAKGNWFFEANIPVKILDANNKVLGQVGAQAEGEWMTTDFVNFSAVLTFETPTTDTGKLIIEKDNPSGLPEHSGSYAIPVRFK